MDSTAFCSLWQGTRRVERVLLLRSIDWLINWWIDKMLGCFPQSQIAYPNQMGIKRFGLDSWVMACVWLASSCTIGNLARLIVKANSGAFNVAMQPALWRRQLFFSLSRKWARRVEMRPPILITLSHHMPSVGIHFGHMTVQKCCCFKKLPLLKSK